MLRLVYFLDAKNSTDCQQMVQEHGLNRTLLVKSFKDQITGRLMLDCAFQYDVYWDEVAKRKEKEDAISEKNS